MSGIWRKAYRDVTKRKVRGILTLLGIIIGVAGIVAIISTSRSLASAQAEAYSNSSQADATFHTYNAPASLAKAILNIPNVAAVELRTTYFTAWKVGDAWRDTLFVGFQDYGNMTVNRIYLEEGSFPRHGEVALERAAREIASVSLGEEIAYRSRAGGVDRDKFLRTVGFIRTPAYPASTVTNVTLAYATAEDVQAMMGAEGNNEILVKVRDFAQRQQTVEAVEDLMRRRNLWLGSTTLRDPENYPGKRELDSLFALMFLFSVVGVVISGFLVANTLSAVIGEQVSEIGAMKAFGATRGHILRLYLMEALFYASPGTGIGLGLGLVGSNLLLGYLAQLLNLSVGFEVAPAALAAGTAIGVGVTVLGAMLPAWMGTRISVKAALDSYGIISTYGQGRVDRLLQRIRGLSPVVLFSLRNLARRKLRTGATIVVVGLSTAAFLAAWSTDASVNGSIEGLYATYGADGFVWFETPVPTGFAGSLRRFSEVQRVEDWAFTQAVLNGYRVRLRGIPAETVLYKKKLVDGRWYSPGERHAVVVAADLAGKYGIEVGDIVRVELDRRWQDYEVVGTVLDSSTAVAATSVGNIFLPTEEVAALQGRRGWASVFAMKIENSTKQSVDQTLARVANRYRDLRPGTYSMEADKEASRRVTQILTAMLYGMVVIVGLIGALGMLNTVTLNVLERRREIGVLRSIGASDGRLLQVFLSEGLFVGAAGAILGLALGIPVAGAFVSVVSRMLFEISFFLPASGLALALLYALVLALAASLLPSYGAARLPVSQALRYE